MEIKLWEEGDTFEHVNVAVEYRYKKMRSGIFATKADVYVYVLGDFAYFVETNKLREEVFNAMERGEKDRFRQLGDNKDSDNYLMPLGKFKSLCHAVSRI